MKKTLLSVLIAAMLLSVFAACAGSETPKDQTAESVTEAAAAPAE